MTALPIMKSSALSSQPPSHWRNIPSLTTLAITGPWHPGVYFWAHSVGQGPSWGMSLPTPVLHWGSGLRSFPPQSPGPFLFVEGLASGLGALLSLLSDLPSSLDIFPAPRALSFSPTRHWSKVLLNNWYQLSPCWFSVPRPGQNRCPLLGGYVEKPHLALSCEWHLFPPKSLCRGPGSQA